MRQLLIREITLVVWLKCFRHFWNQESPIPWLQTSTTHPIICYFTKQIAKCWFYTINMGYNTVFYSPTNLKWDAMFRNYSQSRICPKKQIHIMHQIYSHPQDNFIRHPWFTALNVCKSDLNGGQWWMHPGWVTITGHTNLSPTRVSFKPSRQVFGTGSCGFVL